MSIPLPNGRYRLVERTLVIGRELDLGQRSEILELLRRPEEPAYMARFGLNIELTEDPQAEAVLAYVREQELRHDVHDVYRWTGGPGR